MGTLTTETGDPPPGRPRLSRPRKVGVIVLSLVSVAFAAVSTTQIVLQVWFPKQPETALACRPGVTVLAEAIDRARTQAALEVAAEREALARFRAALEPEWTFYPTIRTRCQDDREALRALRQVELLRYAEERALRYQVLDLSRLRQDVPALTRKLNAP